MKLKEKSAIVVGASSGIGEALARRLAREGWRVALVARRREELERVAGLMDRHAAKEGHNGPSHAQFIYPHDVTNTAEVPDLFDRIVRDLGGLELIIYAAGVMPPVGADEYPTEKDRGTVAVNLIGMMAWLNEAADLFARLKRGTIVGIGSVSGDRGRRGQPAYAASKAGTHCYLEALRNRLHGHGVRVLTIKPGPVDTPMTRGLGNMPFMISAQQAAQDIVGAVQKHKTGTIYIPSRWAFIMAVIRAIPGPLFRQLDLK